MCDVTHLYVCHTWPIHICDVTHSYVWRGPFMSATWLIRMCDVAHSYVWPDSFMCVTWRTWLVHTCDVTHFYVSGIEAFAMQIKGFICVTWLIHVCDVTHVTRSCVWRDSFLREQNQSLRNASQRIHIHDMTHSCVRRDARDSFICVTWRISMWAESKPSRCKSEASPPPNTHTTPCTTHTHTLHHGPKPWSLDPCLSWYATTNATESWHICNWVMAHIWMSHGTYTTEAWHFTQKRQRNIRERHQRVT